MPDETRAEAAEAPADPACPWSEAIAAAHRELSPVDLAFREEARRSPELLDRATFRPMGPDGDLVEKPLQPWLTFLGREKRAELAAASVGVCRLLKSIPARVFGNDAAAMARFYGIPAPVALLALAEPNGLSSLLARGDFVSTAQGFRCIEFNLSSRIGGWETAVIVERAARLPPVARFLAREGVAAAATDTLAELFRHVVREAEGKGLLAGGEANVAIARNRREPKRKPGLQAWFDRELGRACRELAPGVAGRVIDAYPDELVLWQENLYCGRTRIQAVIVWADETPKPAYRSFKSGRIALFNGPIETLLTNKLNLALLSTHAAAEGGLLAAEEREIVARHLPWTREIAPGRRLDFRGEPLPAEELLARHRETLVLKEGTSYGGRWVAIGRFTAPERWLELGRRAAAQGGWVVQELAESLPYLYQTGERGCAPHDVIWGPFVFGDRYAGAFLRMQPKSAADVVNLTQHATQGAIVDV